MEFSIKKIFCSLLILTAYSPCGQAKVDIKNYSAKNYKMAKNAANRLRFESKSTKLGFITTDFDGFAKNFTINYNLNKNILDQIKIKIDTKSFDTNSEARNDKMNEVCLESQKYPEITGTIVESVDLNLKDHGLVVDFIVKDQPYKMKVKLISEKNGDNYKITILGSFSLKDWKIPDPSIAIAKIRDQFDLIFETIL
jgi:polyisoprenoid-binding protein YceI